MQEPADQPLLPTVYLQVAQSGQHYICPDFPTKIVYLTDDQASVALRNFARQRPDGYRDTLGVYWCRGHWHLGNRPEHPDRDWFRRANFMRPTGRVTPGLRRWHGRYLRCRDGQESGQAEDDIQGDHLESDDPAAYDGGDDP